MSEQLTMNIADFLLAGLEPEGIYRLRINSAEIVDRDGRNGPYQQISMQVDLVERLGDGILEKPPGEWLNCGVTGKGLGRFRKLFVAAVGEVPEGTPDPDSGELSVTLDDLVSALIGNESAWTTYFWKRNRDNPKDIEGQLGWSFSSEGTELKEPRPFAEKDNA